MIACPAARFAPHLPGKQPLFANLIHAIQPGLALLSVVLAFLCVRHMRESGEKGMVWLALAVVAYLINHLLTGAIDVAQSILSRAAVAPADGMQGLALEVLTDPVGEVEKFSKDNSFSDDERQAIINAMMAGGDPTKWGLLNAVTLVAQHIGDNGSVERQHELERNAGQLVIVR
jgi:hypothetical protein